VETSLRPFIDKNPRTWMYMQWQGFHRALHFIRNRRFDIIHNHGDWPFLIAGAFTHVPILTTIHNPVQYKFGVKEVYQRYPYVSISEAERAYMPELDYVANVHHGIDIQDFDYNDKPSDYLAFLGRIDPDKGIEEAIEVAKRTGSKLIIAAKIDAPMRPYYRKKIKPLIDGKQIIYVGEVALSAKVALLKNARALLAPIQWDEPFGLATVEAMACGTPVLAMSRGSMPEIITDGKTGYLCKTVDQMVARVADIPKIKRRACRTRVEHNFTSAIMAKKYVAVYERVMRDHRTRMFQHLKTMKSLLIP
jgi:glycosyltransferase involved in cell wall biosynthesis